MDVAAYGSSPQAAMVSTKLWEFFAISLQHTHVARLAWDSRVSGSVPIA